MIVFAALLAGCEQPRARSFEFFMEDGLAREGVLARCNQDRSATAVEAECANARRAAQALAAQEEQARSADLARESERKLVAIRDRDVRQRQADADAAAAAKREADARYESQWRDRNAPRPAGQENGADAPAFGSPLSSVSPPPTNAPLYDVYARGDGQLRRRELELAAVTPPVNDPHFTAPRVEIEQPAIIPRPFRASDDDKPVSR